MQANQGWNMVYIERAVRELRKYRKINLSLRAGKALLANERLCRALCWAGGTRGGRANADFSVGIGNMRPAPGSNLVGED